MRSISLPRSGVTDMTAGEPWRVILRFSLPLLAGNLFQQMYNTVDAAVVGRFVGKGALAAVGTSGPIINLMVGLFIGFSAGAGILISQSFGARDERGVRRSVNTALLLSLLTGIGVTILGMAGTPWLLRMLNTPDEVFGMAREYLWVIFAGVTVSMFYNIAAAILRALGDSWTPLAALGIASLCNIILDLFFVVALDMGVSGAAWATITSQLVSVLFSVRRMGKMAAYIRVSRAFLIPDVHMIGGMLKLGLPAAVQQTALSMGMLLIQSVINDFGENVMAAYVAVMKVDALCILPITTLGLAMTSYAGQNIGAGNMKRVEQGARQGLCLSLSIVLPLSVLLFFFGKYPLMLFTDEPELLAESAALLRILCPFYWTLCIVDLLAGVMRGVGNTVIPMVNAIFCLCLIRIPLLYLIIGIVHSSKALYWSMAASWLCGAVFISLYYRLGRWKRKAAETARRAQGERGL